jgi:hypothetical protein
LTTILVNCDHFPDAQKCHISIKQLRKLGLKSADEENCAVKLVARFQQDWNTWDPADPPACKMYATH